jgi:hypothetical protein
MTVDLRQPLDVETVPDLAIPCLRQRSKSRVGGVNINSRRKRAISGP